MKPLQSPDITILPMSHNPEFEQRESGLAHTPYQAETAFYSLVAAGDVERVRTSMTVFLNDGIVVGNMSADPLRQMQYWAVCCVTLGIRAAIRGGLDEMTAFNESDRYIRAIDCMTDPQAIAPYLMQAVVQLTALVRQSSQKEYGAEIQRCIDYIRHHLHEDLSLDVLASKVGYSRSYLSALFKQQVGMPLHRYILEQRIEEAKLLLQGQTPQQLIAYYLGFCSQTHFIRCFKQVCGITPHQYKRNATAAKAEQDDKA